MKKLVSIFLSLVLVAVSVTCSLVLATANNGEQQSLGLAANWRLYENKTATIGETGTPAGSWAKVTDNTDAKYLHNGTSSVKFSCISQRGATEFSVKKNTDYELSFLYYNESLNAAGTYALSQVAVVLPNGSVAKKDALAFMDGGSGTGTTKTGEWQRIALSFHSGENTTLALTILFAVSPVYIDDFYLVDLSGNNPNKAENWTLYENSSKKVGAEGKLAGSWATVSQNSNAKFTHNGAASLKFSCISQRGAVTLPVEQNKNYELSFWAFSEKLNAAGTYFLSQATVLVPEGEVDPEGKGCLGSANAQGLTKAVNTWVKITVPFNSGSNSAVVFSLLFGSSPVYVSEISLAEKTENPPTPTGLEGWTVYQWDTKEIGQNGTPGPAWATVKKETTGEHDSNGDGQSILIKALAQRVANLFTVKKNTDYALTFKYFVTELNAAKTYSLSVAGITTENGSVVKDKDGYYSYLDNGATAYVANDGLIKNKQTYEATSASTVTGKWQQVKLPFHSGNNEKMALVLVSAVSSMWIDELTLTEEEINLPQKDYGTPKDLWTIDFEDENTQYSTNKNINVAETVGYNGQKTKALHTVPGDHGSVLFLNYATTTTDTDPIYTIPVLPERVYELSWRVKIKENTGDISWLSFYQYYNGKYANIANLQKAKQGEWLYYKVILITEPKQNRFSFTFNAGNPAPEIWLDDINLVLTNYQAFNGYNGPQKRTVINFDDYFVPLTGNTVEVAEAPAYNGQVSNALHTKEGEYNGSQTMNYATATKYSDKVFTIPVKPNTLYNFSLRAYAKSKGKQTVDVPYVCVYIDFATRNVMHLAYKLKYQNNNKWVPFEKSFVTGQDQTMISITIDFGKSVADMYIDDLVLEEVEPGITQNTTLSYCEKPYNLLSNNAAAVSAVNQNKTSVTKISLAPLSLYTFAVTLQGSGSEVFLSANGSDPIGSSVRGVNYSGKITGKAQKARTAYQFVTPSTGEVYLVIKNKGNLQLSNVMLFQTKSNSGDNWDMGLVQNPNIAPEQIGMVENLVAIGSAEEQNLYNGETPATGDAGILPAAIILVLTAGVGIVLLVTGKKGGTRNA